MKNMFIATIALTVLSLLPYTTFGQLQQIQPQQQYPIPIATVIVAEQQLATTTPTPSNPSSELVDQIETIDVSSNQLVVATTRQGPPDSARVAISVVDIASGEALPPLNLTGILLILTRGRYTVNWLQPNRWYGVDFRAEQHYAGGTAVYTNEESHLVKTHRADGSHEEGKPVVTVKARRYGDGGRSLENLVLTIRWEQHPDERPNLDALTNITLFCNDQIKYKQLRLKSQEIDKSVEIRLDNHFEVVEQRDANGSRQMVASIRPKNCPRICWNAELLAETRWRTFRRAAAHHCEQIEAVSARAMLRDFVGYELSPESGDLMVHTNFSAGGGAKSSEDNSTESDAYVQLTAIAIPEGKTADNSTIRYKTFSTKQEGEEFVLDGLDRGKLYAVQYTYGKQSPFAYEESRRFLVDTGSESESGPVPLEPMHLQFNLTNTDSIQPGITAIARLDPRFKKYELGIDVEPLCEPTESTLHFWLDKDRREKELHELRLLDALCTASPAHSVCRVPGTAAGVRGCGLRDGKLCYTTNIVVHGKLFSAPRKCEQLAGVVPPMPTTTTSTTTTTTTTTTSAPKSTSPSTQPQKRSPPAMSPGNNSILAPIDGQTSNSSLLASSANNKNNGPPGGGAKNGAKFRWLDSNWIFPRFLATFSPIFLASIIL